MYGRFFICLLAILLLILTVPPAIRAQSYRERPMPDDPEIYSRPPRLPPSHPFPLPPGTVALSQVSRAAGMIFSGRVTAIARRPASGGQALETVAVTFQVERAIRGVSAGKRLTIVEWIGLWADGQHYQIGEHVLLFLYPPSRLGLTSSVGGPLGRFSVDPAGRVLLSHLHSSAFAADPVLGGKSHVTFGDFAQGVRRASGENER
jgi:hypothetical protein